MSVYGSKKYIPGYQQNWYAGNPNGYQSPYAGQAGLKGLAQYDQQFGDLAAKGQAASAGSSMASSGSASGGEGGGGGIGYGAIGSIASGVFNALPNWYDIQHQGQSRNVTRAVYGDSSQDPIARLLTGHGSDMDAARNEIRSNEVDYSGVKNNDNLLNSWDSNDLQDGVDYKFGWSNIADNLTASGKGAAAGMSIGGPWGALIGGIAGGVFNIFSQLGGANRAEELDRQAENANKNQIANFYETAQRNQARSQREAMMNYFAEGGLLDSGNGITKFNVGGSHEQNPYGGIMQGIAPDGEPNMVEEGEIKYKDYIFSDRFKVTKAMLKKYNLPEKYEGLSFAKVADKLQKETEERPNDPIALSTLESNMERLQEAQEQHRSEKAVRDANQLLENMMAGGGKIHIDPSKKGTFTAAASKHGKSVQEFASQVLAHPENYSPAMRKKANFARNAAKWHELGGHLFALGSDMSDPLAGLPYDNSKGFKYYTDGAYDPGYLAWLNSRDWTGADKETFNRLAAHYAKYNNGATLTPEEATRLGQDKKFGEFHRIYGRMYDRYQNPPVEKLPTATTDEVIAALEQLQGPNELPAEFAVPEQTAAPKGVEEAMPTPGSSMLRYAPVVGSGIGALVSTLFGPDYTYADQLRALAGRYNPISAPALSGYRRYAPYDINLANAEAMAQQASLQRGNRATANRATQMAHAIALENAYEKAAASRNLAWQEANEARRAAVDQYNLGINKANADIVQNYDRINQDIRERRIRMLQAAAAAQDASATAWSENVSNNVTNFFNQLGNLGKDQWSQNQLMSYLKEHPELLAMLA